MSGNLAKPESWPPRFSRTSITLVTPASRRRRKNSSAVFPAKPIVQSVEFMRRSPALDGFRINAKGAAFCLEPIGIFKRRAAVGGKQRITREAREVLGVEDTVFGLALGFDGAAAADVPGRHSSGNQFRA